MKVFLIWHASRHVHMCKFCCACLVSEISEHAVVFHSSKQIAVGKIFKSPPAHPTDSETKLAKLWLHKADQLSYGAREPQI